MAKRNTIWTLITLALLSLLLAIAPSVVRAKVPIQSDVISADPFQSTVVVAQATPDEAVVNSLEQGRRFYILGRYREAAQAWRNAVSEYEARGDRPNQALGLSYLSLTHQALNQWDSAQTTLDRSLDVLETADANPIVWGQVLNTQATLQLQLGQAQIALENWQRAQQFYEEAGDELGAIGSQINQGQALQYLGFYRRSQEQLVALNERLMTVPDSGLKISAFRNLGTALKTIGDFEESYAAFAEGLAIAQRINAQRDYSSMMLNIGKLAAELDNFETALPYYEIAADNATNESDKFQARLAQLNIYLQQQQWADSKRLLSPIRQQLATLPASRTSVYGTINLAHNLMRFDVNHRLLSVHKLSQLLATAIQNAQHLKDARAEAYGLQKLGELYAHTHQKSEAIQLTQQALTLARNHQAEEIVAQASWQLGRFLKEEHRPSQAITAYREAIATLQSLRKDLVAINQDVQFSFQDSIEPVYREFVALLLDDNPDQEALAQARELIEDLQLAELDNFFRQACLDAQPQQIDQIDPKAAVIYPIILPDRLAVIVSQANQPLQYHVTPIRQDHVETTLLKLLELLHPSSDHQEYLQVSQQVYQWLIPDKQELTNTETLVFVLDGLLRNIPMAALYDGEQYLIENYGVALSPGLQLMAAQSLQPTKMQAVIGGISEARSGFSALPEVKSEVKNISQLFDALPLLNEAFTSNAVGEQLRNNPASIVHLATHGQFSSNQEETFLLTWENRINISQLADLLKKREITQGQAIELLVLSACNTAAGDNRAILGLAGLAVRSGARSTLATLWPVKDQPAAQLMTQFYEFFRQTNISKAEALRQAQLTLLNDPNYEIPFFWSSYVLVGNWL